MISHKSKILLLTLEYPPQIGGVARYYKNIVDFWPEKDQIKVLKTRLFKILWPKWSLVFFEIIPYLLKYKIKLIFIGQILPLGYIGYIIKKILKVPYIVFCHGMDIGILKGRKKFFAKIILENADMIVVNSNFTAKILKKLTHKDPLIIYPTPNFELLNFKKNSEKVKEKFILLTVCRFVERKGILDVLEAIKEIENINYFIIGDGPLKKEIKDFIKSNKLEEKVKVFSPPSYQKLSEFYKNCDVFVLTPFEPKEGDIESFGIVYLEAALFKKPSIASKTGGVLEAVVDMQTGILVEPRDINGIRNAILKLKNNQDLLKKLGEQAYQRVIEKFHPKLQTLKFYSEIKKIFPDLWIS